MEARECEVCSKMVKEKYKHYKTWRNLAIVFMCLTVLFAILFFANGDLFKETKIEYENDVVIENKGVNNNNMNNGNIVVEEEKSNTSGVVIIFLILVGGAICGCYLVSQKNHKNKK